MSSRSPEAARDRLGSELSEPDLREALARLNVRAVAVDDAPSGDAAAELLGRAGAYARFEDGRLIAIASQLQLDLAAARADEGARPVLQALQELYARLEAPVPALRLRSKRLALDGAAHVMGILNVTPDSFFDRGRYSGVDAARARAAEMVAEGAALIDIGGQSYAHWNAPVTADEEIARVVPVVKALVADRLPVALSIDTFKPPVARAALEAGAHLINDCSGLLDPALAEVTATYDAGLVVMHMRGRLNVRNVEDYAYTDALREILVFLDERVRIARAAGVAPESIAVDPGLEFGKEPPTDLEILDRYTELTSLGYPILFAGSRKSFIGRIFNRPARELLAPSLATAALGIVAGARLLRVHDVAPTVQLATMMAAAEPSARRRITFSSDMPETATGAASGAV